MYRRLAATIFVHVTPASATRPLKGDISSDLISLPSFGWEENLQQELHTSKSQAHNVWPPDEFVLHGEAVHAPQRRVKNLSRGERCQDRSGIPTGQDVPYGRQRTDGQENEERRREQSQRGADGGGLRLGQRQVRPQPDRGGGATDDGGLSRPKPRPGSAEEGQYPNYISDGRDASPDVRRYDVRITRG